MASDRSVTAGSVSNSSIVTGDSNLVNTTSTQHLAVPPDTVDIQAEFKAFRAILAGLHVEDRGKLDRALEDASEEVAKPNPDKKEFSEALSRAARVAKTADDFSEHLANLTRRTVALASWLGLHGHALLAALGPN